MRRKRRGMDCSYTLSLSLSLPPPLPVFSCSFFFLRRPHYLNARNRLVLPVLPRARIVPSVQELHGLPLKQNKQHRFVSVLFVAYKQALHFEWRAKRVARDLACRSRDFALYPAYGELARRPPVLFTLANERR